jgi:hypothetical protein
MRHSNVERGDGWCADCGLDRDRVGAENQSSGGSLQGQGAVEVSIELEQSTGPVISSYSSERKKRKALGKYLGRRCITRIDPFGHIETEIR